MDRAALELGEASVVQPVDGVPKDVEHPPEGGLTNTNHDRRSGVDDDITTSQALDRGHGDRPNGVLVDVGDHLEPNAATPVVMVGALTGWDVRSTWRVGPFDPA